MGNGKPTSEDWDRHREIITKLFDRKTLKALRDHMQTNHGFSAR